MSTDQRQQTLLTVLETFLEGVKDFYDKTHEFNKHIARERSHLAKNKAHINEVEIIIILTEILELANTKYGQDAALHTKIVSGLSGLNAISDKKLKTFEQYREYLNQQLPRTIKAAQESSAAGGLITPAPAASDPPRAYLCGYPRENVLIGAGVGAGLVVLLISIAVILFIRKRKCPQCAA